MGHAFGGRFTTALIEEIRKLQLPPSGADSANLPSGDVRTIEGRFIWRARHPSGPGMVTLGATGGK